MTFWVIAVTNIALFVAAALRVARRRDDSEWWRSVLRDRIALVAGTVAALCGVAVVVATGHIVGLPSALLVGATVAAVVGRIRARCTSE